MNIQRIIVLYIYIHTVFRKDIFKKLNRKRYKEYEEVIHRRANHSNLLVVRKMQTKAMWESHPLVAKIKHSDN